MTSDCFYQLIHGDCYEVLPKLDYHSVDLVITDPPYGIKYHSGWYVHGNPHNPIINDKSISFSFLPLCLRVLKPNSGLFCFCRMDGIPEVKKRLGDKYKNTIIWVKNNWSAGDLEHNFGNMYELIVYATKGKPKIRTKRYPNVWKFDRVNSPGLRHPTEKPVKLIERCIKTLSDVGDVILDPFLGSGTTMEACQNTRRSCIGIEISPCYYEVTKRRCFGKRFLDHNVSYIEGEKI